MILVYQNDIKILKNNLKQEKNYIYLKKKGFNFNSKRCIRYCSDNKLRKDEMVLIAGRATDGPFRTALWNSTN
jgi:hypothetical protein